MGSQSHPIVVMCVSLGGWAPNLCGGQPGQPDQPDQPRTFEPNEYPTNEIML